MQIFEYGIYLAWCFTYSIGLPIWPHGTRKCNRYPSSIDTFNFFCPLLFVAGLPGHHWCTRYTIAFLPDMHNLRTVDILVSACLYQKTNLQSKHTPGRAAVLAVLRESRTMPIKELCRWPNFIICCQPIDSLDYNVSIFWQGDTNRMGKTQMKELKRGSTHSTHPMVSRVNLPMHLPSVHWMCKA